MGCAAVGAALLAPSDSLLAPSAPAASLGLRSPDSWSARSPLAEPRPPVPWGSGSLLGKTEAQTQRDSSLRFFYLEESF